ncbi:hypothetical protein [Brevibacillus porteri]|uniref:hypothetical protein n=1 Tax=Brevibacillus porteri TaxID=2126350 RepID=UPI003639CE75
MTDLDKLAEVFASGSSEIVGTYRLVIQPNSELREFRTVWHGFLFTIRGAARMCVNETVYELHPGTVFHAARHAAGHASHWRFRVRVLFAYVCVQKHLDK